MNTLAFSKIMKKYDKVNNSYSDPNTKVVYMWLNSIYTTYPHWVKDFRLSHIIAWLFQITSKRVSKAFLKKVDDSYLGSSDKVNKYVFGHFNTRTAFQLCRLWIIHSPNSKVNFNINPIEWGWRCIN